MGTSQACGSAWSIGRFQVDRRSFPAQVLLVGPGPCDGGPGQGQVHGGTVPCTLTTAPVSTEWRSTATRAPTVRPPESSGLSMVKRDPSWVMGCLLHQYSPGQAGREARGCRGGGLGPVPGWASTGESGVPDLAVPGTLTGVCKNEIIATNRPRHPWIPAYAEMTEWAQ